MAPVTTRLTDADEARIQREAELLGITKCQLLHDLAIRFLEQEDKHRFLISGLSKLDRAQRTREIARKLSRLWSDDPEIAVTELRVA